MIEMIVQFLELWSVVQNNDLKQNMDWYKPLVGLHIADQFYLSISLPF